ncbi:MAG: hypothetical protein JW941_10590 [Candidatus Coatesbacteria bacterium]|nr:hypothetical protein [Candidatus Coatesbacteria bacterium]
MRREIPLIITFVCGITMIIQFFIPHWPFSDVKSYFQHTYMIIAAFAMILGICNLTRLHIFKIRDRRENWGYSIVLLVGLAIMAIPGLFQGIHEGTMFEFLFKNAHVPMNSTMFSLLAFFVASASYRAFRARTFDAALLLIAGFAVMLGRAPIGDTLTSFMPEGWQMSDLANWIMAFPNTAGQRAIMMGSGLGIVATSLRVILGIERSYLGGE